MSMGSNEPMTVPSVDSGLFCFPPIKDRRTGRGGGEGLGAAAPQNFRQEQEKLGQR